MSALHGDDPDGDDDREAIEALVDVCEEATAALCNLFVSPRDEGLALQDLRYARAMLAELRVVPAMTVSDDPYQKVAVVRVVGERARASLPVIATCRMCACCQRLSLQVMRWECEHGSAPSASTVDPDAAPPEWCPLRSGSASRAAITKGTKR